MNTSERRARRAKEGDIEPRRRDLHGAVRIAAGERDVEDIGALSVDLRERSRIFRDVSPADDPVPVGLVAEASFEEALRRAEELERRRRGLRIEIDRVLDAARDACAPA